MILFLTWKIRSISAIPSGVSALPPRPCPPFAQRKSNLCACSLSVCAPRSNGLSDAQLDTPYRDGGWTVRQVVHHLADSHANSVIRFKLALTEDWPTVKPYDEAAWARLPDSCLPIDGSLVFIGALHARWVALLESMQEADFQRGFNHPELGRQNLATSLALYEWHSRHHTAHITSLRARMGW